MHWWSDLSYIGYYINKMFTRLLSFAAYIFFICIMDHCTGLYKSVLDFDESPEAPKFTAGLSICCMTVPLWVAKFCQNASI